MGENIENDSLDVGESLMLMIVVAVLNFWQVIYVFFFSPLNSLTFENFNASK